VRRSDCPDDGELSAFNLGDLPEDVLEVVARHLEVCSWCESRAQRLDGQTDPIIEALRRSAPAGQVSDGPRGLAEPMVDSVAEGSSSRLGADPPGAIDSQWPSGRRLRVCSPRSEHEAGRGWAVTAGSAPCTERTGQCLPQTIVPNRAETERSPRSGWEFRVLAIRAPTPCHPIITTTTAGKTPRPRRWHRAS
jgi:hypothetical protein